MPRRTGRRPRRQRGSGSRPAVDRHPHPASASAPHSARQPLGLGAEQPRGRAGQLRQLGPASRSPAPSAASTRSPARGQRATMRPRRAARRPAGGTGCRPRPGRTCRCTGRRCRRPAPPRPRRPRRRCAARCRRCPGRGLGQHRDQRGATGERRRERDVQDPADRDQRPAGSTVSASAASGLVGHRGDRDAGRGAASTSSGCRAAAAAVTNSSRDRAPGRASASRTACGPSARNRPAASRPARRVSVRAATTRGVRSVNGLA